MDKLQNSIALQARGTGIYFCSSLVAMLCALFRYVLLARLLGPEQLGLAAVLILTGQFFDSISDAAADRFLILDKDGDSADLQNMIQLTQLIRGALVALCLIIFAYPIALLYNAPQLAWPLVGFAFTPFVNGLVHLDMRRVQRQSDFRLEGEITLFAEIAGLLVAVMAAYYSRSFIAVVYGQVARSLVVAIGSHIRADRRYGIGYSHKYMAKLAAFSLPLMINGAILFFAGQADRLLVGKLFGLEELGRFSAVLLLIFYPTAVIQRFIHGMFLPLVAKENYDGRSASSGDLAGMSLIFSVTIAGAFIVIAPPTATLLFGHKFAQPFLIFTLIAVLQTSRFIRIWPATVAIAIGRSRIEASSNLVRLVGFPCGILASTVFGISGLISGLIVGEIVALLASVLMTNKATAWPAIHELDRVLEFIVFSVLILSGAVALQVNSPALGATSFLLAGGVLIFVLIRERQTLIAITNLVATLFK